MPSWRTTSYIPDHVPGKRNSGIDLGEEKGKTIWDDGELTRAVSSVMEVRGRDLEARRPVFRGELKFPPDAAVRLLRVRLAEFGMIPFLSRERGQTLIRCGVTRLRTTPRRRWLPLALFLATLLSTVTVGALMAGSPPSELLARPGLLRRGIPFAAALMIILACHEFSHYFASLRHGIRTSLPTSSPFPTSSARWVR